MTVSLGRKQTFRRRPDALLKHAVRRCQSRSVVDKVRKYVMSPIRRESPDAPQAVTTGDSFKVNVAVAVWASQYFAFAELHSCGMVYQAFETGPD